MHRLLDELMGDTWTRIQASDRRGREARPANPRRHLLAILSDHANEYSEQFVRGIWPGNAPDYLAFHGVVSILDRCRLNPLFPECIAQMVSFAGFRHNMTVIGFADHITRHTNYPIRLVSGRERGERVVDLILGEGPDGSIQMETKTPQEFDGPIRALTPQNVRGAISRAWAKAVSGPRPQLPTDRPGALLLGGLTMRVETLPVFETTALEWLRSHGAGHPNLWGIIAQTFWTYSITPPGRTIGDGAPMTIDGRMGVRLRMVRNPSYAGSVQLAPAPYADE
jgi:hypothetical protein